MARSHVSTTPPQDTVPTQTSAWLGWVMFAGIMMILIGTFQAIDGLVAIFNDKWFLVTRNDLVVSMDFTTWGWIHLILGVIVLGAGFGVLRGSTWGRFVGIVLAMLSAIASLLFIPAYPVWSIIVIALDVLVIYSLAVYGRGAAY